MKLRQSPTQPPVSAQPPEIEELGGTRVTVAVGKSVEKAVALLRWTFPRFKNAEICLLHVHQPSDYIPTPLGKLPASQASNEVVSLYRMEETQQMRKLLLYYLSLCRQSKVKASTMVTEASQVQIEILDLVNKHGIRTLVMGAVPENCIKMRRSSRKATFITKNAPQFCEIWFVSKGKHLWTREALADPTFALPLSQPDNTISMEIPRSTSTGNAEIIDMEMDDTTHFESTLSISANRSDSYGFSKSSSTSSSYESNSTAELVVSSSFGMKDDEESLSAHLTKIRVEAEVSKDEASLELLIRKASESRAVEALSKVKALESAFANEIGLRKDTEDGLKLTIQEQETLVEKRERVTRELQKAMRSFTLLDSHAQEANCRREEVVEELKLIHASISALHREKQKIRRQKMEATCWLDCWKASRQDGNSNFKAVCGSYGDSIELAEFSLADLQSATCDFSDKFKIGQSGYGSLYKGELLGRTVAIKRMHPQNIQCQCEFEQEVQVLAELRHPHLVSLLGICSEAWSLIYEYLPNRSLQDHLSRRSNSHLLTWKIRARIISNISSALLYLHTHEPVNIVHGGLKPENITFDSNLSCKISDSGIFRLVPNNTLRCPSFRQNMEPKGIFSYTDPEFHRTGYLTLKSDIYSFGLIILQLLTGRSPVGLAAEVTQAVSCGKTVSILDLSSGEWPNFVAKRLIGLGLECCQLSSRDRPELTPRLVMELQQLHTLEERIAPPLFLCPILHEIMHDPRVAADGFTYEGEAMHGWLESGGETSPMTNLKLDHLELTPNHALRVAIQDWVCKS